MKLVSKVALVSVIALAACTQMDRKGGGGTTKVPPVKVLPVKAQITAVSLAEDCSKAEVAASKQAPADDIAAGAVAGDCAGPDCGSFCQQTSMTITFTAGDGTEPAKVKIAKVRIYDAKTKTDYGELIPRNPRIWEENQYKVWGESIAPAQNLQVIYDMTAPDWNKITNGQGRWGAQDKTFRVEAVIQIGDQSRTLEMTVESADIMQEPEVVT